MKKAQLVAVLIFTCSVSFAEKPWAPPTNIKGYCQQLESTIVSMYAAVVNNNRNAMTLDDLNQRNKALSESTTMENYINSKQAEWQRLSCTQLLYSK